MGVPVCTGLWGHKALCAKYYYSALIKISAVQAYMMVKNSEAKFRWQICHPLMLTILYFSQSPISLLQETIQISVNTLKNGPPGYLLCLWNTFTFHMERTYALQRCNKTLRRFFRRFLLISWKLFNGQQGIVRISGHSKCWQREKEIITYILSSVIYVRIWLSLKV